MSATATTDEQVTYRPVGTGYEVVRRTDSANLGTVRRADTGKGWRAENLAGALIGAGHGRRTDAARQLLEERERFDARAAADDVQLAPAAADVFASRAAALEAMPTDDEVEAEAARLGYADAAAYLAAPGRQTEAPVAAEDGAPFVDVVARGGRPVYLACTADGRVVGEYASRAEATAHLPAASILDELTPEQRARFVLQAAARAAGLYLVTTGGAVVGMYPDAERADGVAETYRANGTGASTLRPCGHTWNRYAPAPECQECASLRSLRSLEAIGGRLNPQRREQLAREARFEAILAAIDAEAPAVVAELEGQVADTVAASPALTAYLARTEGTRRDAVEVLAERAPSADRPQLVIPREGEVAAARQAEVVSEARSLEELTPAAVQGLTGAGEAIAEPEGMDQVTARKLAAQVGGIATQESRHHGRRAKPGEPWIVTVGSTILREVPGEVEEPAEVHLMGDDLLDACGTAPRGGGLSVAPYTTPERITCPRCRELASQEREAAQELLAALSRELDGEPVETNPVDELQQLTLATGTQLGADTSRPARHLAAVLRGADRGVVFARFPEGTDGDRQLEARYEEVRGLATVDRTVTAAVTLLRDGGLVTAHEGQRVEWRPVSLTSSGHRLLVDLTFLTPRQ